MGRQPPPLTESEGEALANLAARAVRARLRGAAPDGSPPAQPALRRVGCSFVTLHNAGALRGCVGTLDPVRPLYRDVTHNAGRAMTDPRMRPVEACEWPALEVSVSVLERMEPLAVHRLAELVHKLRPHIDGLIVRAGSRQATFLPAVWAKLPDPAEFVAALLAKGGWPPDRLPVGACLMRYAACEFHAVRHRAA